MPDQQTRDMLRYSRQIALYEIAVVQALRKKRPFPLRVMEAFGVGRCLFRITVKDKRGAQKRAERNAFDCINTVRHLRAEVIA